MFLLNYLQLPYAYDALEPNMPTMKFHWKHHNAYTTNLNAVAGTDMEGKQSKTSANRY
jgi:superoxide dismutase